MINLKTFKPQLVGEGHPETFIYNNGAIFVEPKVDGIRCLVEKKDGTIRLYSRSGREMTKKYESILSALSNGIMAERVILDGELCVVKGKFFTSSNYVMRRELQKGEAYVYFPFDVLELGEQSLLDDPLLSRKQTLQLIIEPSNSLQPIPYSFMDNMEDINCLMKKILEKGMEGLVLKDGKQYSPNSRYNWIKLKPFSTLDLEVLAREPRKDNKGWVYKLLGKGVEAKASSQLDIAIGTIVEVKFQSRYEHRLRFPQILRIRDDLVDEKVN
ncbi:MAG: RNA ligase family protein [Candidatus Woesearchaeota archaeon]